jgi:hypothetical protein
LVDAGGARDTAPARAFNWIVGNYVDSTLMHLRRELDRQDGTECLLADHRRVMRCISFTAQLGRTWKCRAVACVYPRLVCGVIRTDL